jgi:hypothetical protein
MPDTRRMVRYQIHLDPIALKRMERHRDTTGVPVSEFIRRAVEAKLDGLTSGLNTAELQTRKVSA